MSFFLTVLDSLFIIYPAWFVIGVMGFFALMAVLLVLKVVAFAKSVIPFL